MFNGFELYTTNFFTPLSGTETSVDTLNSTIPFSPLHTSSPHRKRESCAHSSSSPGHDTQSVNTSSINDTNQNSNLDILPNKTNLRLLTVNCSSIREHRSEFIAALDYVKPDLICGTESWLRGIQPGKEPSKNAIKSIEVFPEDYFIHRNEPGHEKTCIMSYANNKGADQPAHPRSLISAFVVRCLDSVMSLVSVTKISSLMLASVAEQASLSLTWSETPEAHFLMARLK